ncbi:MAG: exo-alpha-sialidase [Fimbriimonadales bacterium]|nr:exo-alpha-sialidase [Fimbriimonadales bacterium]
MFESALIFPLSRWHNHSSCLVECPDGSLLVCWYSGSGEREADDVQILGARWREGRWSRPFLMADTPNYPDINPILFLDPRGRLWLIWAAVLNHQWEGALLKYRLAVRPGRRGCPRWKAGDVFHISPDERFVQAIDRWADTLAIHHPSFASRLRQLNSDELSRRLGWMPRVHPLILGERILLPLYSDGFDLALIAISEDAGDHWQFSEPLLSLAGVQPSLVMRRDGAIVAYLRDNGPPPKRVMTAVSYDGGYQWSEVSKTDIPNPGASIEAIALQTGEWLMVANDTEQGRHQLAILLSQDEGHTWQVKRYLEREPPGAGSFSYPSVIQARDGTIHVTYSYALPTADSRRSTIKWVRFTRDWLEP